MIAEHNYRNYVNSNIKSAATIQTNNQRYAGSNFSQEQEVDCFYKSQNQFPAGNVEN